MARYGKILLLAVLTGFLLADIEGLSRFPSRNRAPAGTAIAAEAGGSTTQGITVTRPVPSASESLSDVQARAPFLEEPSPRDRQVPFRRIPRSADTTISSPQLSLSLSPAAPVAAAPEPMAPAFDSSFAGLGNPTMGDVVPPDTMGAAGPAHLVTILNSQFGVFNKATGLVIPNSVVRLESFWSALDNATGNASQFVFDPKVLYDTNSGRFVAVTLSAHDGPPSWVLIAMSAGSDPTGIWYKVAIRADVNTDNVPQNNWADYPGLGVDANNIYVTANMFPPVGPFQYTKAWVIQKDQSILNGLPGSLTWTEISPISGDSFQPAHSFDGATTEYLIREAGPGTLRLASITGGTMWNDLGTITVTSFASIDLPAAPQFGNPNGIDTSDIRLLNAVFRNGSLWATHHVLGPSGKVEVAWYQINPGPPVSLVTQGRVNDPVRWYYYPSITVNSNGDVAIGFTGSSPSEYASAYYTARSITGPAAGVMQPPSLLKTGVAPYFKTGQTLGGTGTDNRWGDFSATVVDPSDNTTFWTLQEYAAAPATVAGTLRSMWGTWWGKFRAPAIGAPVLTALAVSTTQVNLTWTAPGGQIDFQVERRQLPGGDFGAIASNLGEGVLSYIDNTGVAGTTYSYRIRASSQAPAPGPDSFSNEATAVTQSPPPAGGGGGGGGCSISHGTNRERDVSPLATVLILLSPVGVTRIRRHLMRNSPRFRP